jgi:hypothetical protein
VDGVVSERPAPRPSLRPSEAPPPPRRPERPLGERVRNVSAPTAVALVAALVALALDLRVALRAERPIVPREVMARARQAVDAEKKAGTLVVHSPLLGVEELAGLGDLAARPDLPSAELRGSRRILVVDLAAAPMRGFGDEARVVEVGEGVVLRVFEPPGGQPQTLYDLVADVSRTEMRVERPRGTITSRCTAPRAEGGRACPGEPDWLYLAPRQLVIEGKNVTCVWAHPTTGGDLVHTIPAPSEPLAGHQLVLELESGMTDEAVRTTPDGATVRTDVEQGGRIKGALTLVNRVGWARTQVPVDAGRPIELRVSTPRDGRRHHCLAGRVLEVELKR